MSKKISDLEHNVDSFRLFLKISKNEKVKTVLDIGSGVNSPYVKFMKNNHLEVETVDFHDSATYSGDYNELTIDKKYDAVLCYNCAEYQLNLHNFLTKIHKNLKEGGILAISVPLWKSTIVDGHVVAFPNAGILIYNLIMAKWNCASAKVNLVPNTHPHEGQQIAVILKKRTIKDFPDDLTMGDGDLDKLYDFLPKVSDKSINKKRYKNKRTVRVEGKPVQKLKFDGNFLDINWDEKI